MKSKLRWLLLLISLALLAWVYQAASWRPKLIGELQASSVNAPKLLSAFGNPALLISPDEKYLVAVGRMQRGYILTMWNPQSRVQLWNNSANITRQFPLLFSPDGHDLVVVDAPTASGRVGFKLSLLDAATGKKRRTIPSNLDFSNIQGAAFLSNHELVISKPEGATVLDMQTGKTIRKWKFPVAGAGYVSADGSTVIVLNNTTDDTSTRVTVYNSKHGRRRASWTSKGELKDSSLSPDGKLLATHQRISYAYVVPASPSPRIPPSSTAIIYDTATGKQIGTPLILDSPDLLLTWSANSREVLATFSNKSILMDAHTGRKLSQSAAYFQTQILALAPNGETFYTLDSTGKVWSWRLH